MKDMFITFWEILKRGAWGFILFFICIYTFFAFLFIFLSTPMCYIVDKGKKMIKNVKHVDKTQRCRDTSIRDDSNTYT